MNSLVGLASKKHVHDGDGEKERGTSLNHKQCNIVLLHVRDCKISGCTTVYGDEILKLTGVVAVDEEEEEEDLVRMG
jgi:hypothetical protein